MLANGSGAVAVCSYKSVLISSEFIICRYVYRFVCDLQSLLGYTPEELHAMVDLQPLVKKEDDR